LDEATNHLSALAGSFTLQSLIDTITKGVVDKFSSFLPKKNGGNASKNVEVDSDEELAKHMSKLSINKAMAKGIEAGVNAVIKSSKHRCSNCNRTGHNSRKCTRKKRSKRGSKKRGSVNKVAVDSAIMILQIITPILGIPRLKLNPIIVLMYTSLKQKKTSKRKAKSDKSLSKKSSSKKHSSQKIQKKSGTIIDSQIRKIILAMFNDPEVIETIRNNINNMNLSVTRPDFINYREPAPEIPDSDGEDEMLDDPMEIDFVRRKEPVISIATIPVKIKRLKIPALVLDSGAEPAIVSEDIVKRIGGKIDRSEKYDLSGICWYYS